MLEYEFVIKEHRRAMEQAAADHRLARQAARIRRQDRRSRTNPRNRWARLVAWMPRPTCGGAAAPAIPYARHETG